MGPLTPHFMDIAVAGDVDSCLLNRTVASHRVDRDRTHATAEAIHATAVLLFFPGCGIIASFKRRQSPRWNSLLSPNDVECYLREFLHFSLFIEFELHDGPYSFEITFKGHLKQTLDDHFPGAKTLFLASFGYYYSLAVLVF